MIQKGKIARLPREIRDQLNRRLSENEPGGSVLRWLNELPAVQEILAREFAGSPLSKQNLHAWRTGPFTEWQARQDMLEQARELAADAREASAATEGKLTDHLATVLATRYAAALSGWNGEPDENLSHKLRVLRSVCQDIVELRRGDQHGVRLQMAQERLGREREQTEAEVIEHFKCWVKNPDVREVICQDWISPEERERRLNIIFGLEPKPPKTQEEADRDQMNKYRKVFGMEPLPEEAEEQDEEAQAAETQEPEAQEAEAEPVPPGQTGSSQVKAGQGKSRQVKPLSSTKVVPPPESDEKPAGAEPIDFLQPRGP